MTYTVQPNQSLADIALTVYGGIGGAFWLIEDNPTKVLHLADRLRVGDALTLRADKVNPRYVTYLAQYPTIATAEAGDFPAGVGAWWLDEYVVADPDPLTNIAPVATVTTSSTYPAFLMPQSVVVDPLPPDWLWTIYGWNDNTSHIFPDWLQLTWFQPVSFSSVEVLGLTTSLGYTYDPAVQSAYALRTYEVQIWQNNDWVGVTPVVENFFAYKKHTFPTLVTDRLRIYVSNSADGEWSRIVQVRVNGNL